MRNIFIGHKIAKLHNQDGFVFLTGWEQYLQLLRKTHKSHDGLFALHTFAEKSNIAQFTEAGSSQSMISRDSFCR